MLYSKDRNIKLTGVRYDTRQPNYMKIGKNHIFMNFIPINLPYVEELLQLDQAHRIHIFVTSTRHTVDTISYLVGEVHKNPRRKKVIIHVPKFIEDMATVLVYKLQDLEDELGISFNSPCYGVHYRVQSETIGPTFSIPGTNHSLEFKYTEDGIDVCYHINASSKYENYDNPYTKNGEFVRMDYTSNYIEHYIFKNRVMRLYPEVFKRRIISDFRKLTTIHERKMWTDEEIWRWIYSESNWNITVENMYVISKTNENRGNNDG